MAYELVAKAILQDGISGKLQKMEDRSRRLEKAMAQLSGTTGTKLTRATETAGRGFAHMGAAATRSFGAIDQGASRMIKSVVGIGSAYLTARAGLAAFDKTIGAAARREMADTTITALFKGDTKTAEKYFSFIDDRAAISMFKQQDFLNTSSAFIPVNKDIDQLKTMTLLAERLGASNAEQGLAGAAYAMRELFAGDTTSLVERFNLPRSVVNTFKNLPIKEQLTALDMLLNKMGFSEEFLKKQGTTALSQYEQATDKVNLALQKMGKQGLEKLKPLLESFNRSLDGPAMARFADIGSNAIAKLADGTVKGLTAAKSYIDRNYINNPAFTKLDFEGQVSFVAGDIGNKMDTWMTSTAIPKLVDYGGKLGTEMITSMAGAAKAATEGNPLLALLLAGFIGAKTPGPIPLKIAVSLVAASEFLETKGMKNYVQNLNDPRLQQVRDESLKEEGMWGLPQRISTKIGDFLPNMAQKYLPEGIIKDWAYPKKNVSATLPAGSRVPDFGIDGTHAGGLSRVPYSPYRAILHKDETVLTKAEADDRREGRGSGGYNGPLIGKIADTVVIREDADVDRIAGAIARELRHYSTVVGY